ncbi:MAG: 50S ribosomal protein L25 [Spirochaetales bacterium]|nr:MAG: 50S ribosomal protein L25 [Spirochaetales bacterium]
MNSNQLVAEPRVASGKGAARALRREGRIPAVLYGEGEPMALSVDEKEWNHRFLHVGGNSIIDLAFGKKTQNVLVKDTQDDILTGRVKHIDFYAIHAGQKLNTMVPVVLEGTPIGVREGGILDLKVEQLEVVCLPKDIPAKFVLDISNLQVGESLHVGDIDIPEEVELRSDPEETLVVISHASAEEAAVEEEEGIEEEEGTEESSEASAEE